MGLLHPVAESVDSGHLSWVSVCLKATCPGHAESGLEVCE